MPQSLAMGFYMPRYVGGGAELMTAKIAEEMARRGHSVSLVVNQRAEDQPALPQGVRLVVLESDSVIACAKALSALASEAKLDVLVSALPMANLAADLAVSMFGARVKVVNAWHGFLRSAALGRGYMAQLGCGILSRIADANIVVSQALREALVRGGAPRDRLTLIYNGVASPSRVAPFVCGRPYVLNAASLTPHKNQGMLLQAFARFRKVHDWDLLIAGRGPKEAELRKLAQDLGIADRVHFLGFREDIMRYHAGASLFALSSDVESFGNVILEALSFGVPVVATDCGGPREVLGDNAFGWLTPPGDPKAFGRAMLDAASAAPAPDKLKSRSRQFSLGRTADAYEKLCIDLVTHP